MDTAFDNQFILEKLHAFTSSISENETHQNKHDGTMEQIHTLVNNFADVWRALDESTIVALTDTAGKIIYANEKFCEISKYSREELIGNTHRLLNSGYHGREFFQKMWDTIIRGEVWSEEVKNKAKDGTFYWVKTTVVPLLDDDGMPYRYITFRTDITEGKMAEEKLREGLKNDFIRTVNALHNIVFKLHRNENGVPVYTLFEGKLASQLGLRTGNVLGKTPYDVFPIEVAELMDQHNLEAFDGKRVIYNHRYMNRDFHTTLSPIIENNNVIEIIGSTSEITDLKRAEEIIRRMAYQDSLTKLPNRRMFTEDLTRALQKASEADYEIAVLFIDLDRFKQINDTFGHSIGDKLLVNVAERLIEYMTGDGHVYRLGGDEFVVLIREVDAKASAEIVARELLYAFRTTFPLDHHEFFITCSIGIAIYPFAGLDMESLMKNADTAMYYAKNHGRNGYRFYTPEMNATYEDHLRLEIDLRRALENQEFELYYQPKVDIDTGKLTGMEALLRWNHPKKGYISPASFIPIAEETGLIIPLGELVLKMACAQNKKWMEAGYPKLCVAVNVSAIQFQQPDFVLLIEMILQSTGLDPEYLELEMTENSMMNDVEESLSTLRELHQLGISIAIDDFGTGYSSLGYLKRFPINALKVDRSFVKDVTTDAGDAAIVKAVIHLAHSMGLTVVAEGVETEEVLRFLREQECDEVQGYYYSRPLPEREFTDLLERGICFTS
ncbi:PAS domain S-box-containing protein/diguanylate cyclase (GGDEF)-like protein [Aneurinibacillus soli]|uniref:Phytochrome-like protein cph2 n=1 Tax=Aneurinibacillus soli TaxID=1500254 RepID=A0A0U5B1P5_9BACL|nr:EAL domain-containing protein [Aneurinibacillus soli]PYE60369.1 PAS domain S-box-containing protein/diguanylate cyclase (GGDEF)-like protein [Aneurinibacillus soli]BAU27231.1 Phytochrome-like protein cph2 [Aneurinibacillus soli]